MQIHPQQDVMALNNSRAAANRALFARCGVAVVNILGSPGAGKTSLVERLLSVLPADFRTAVIEGDLATARDAARVAQLGAQVVQINTDGGCHLDAQMVANVLPLFELEKFDLLLIENVGNLVCPSGFDLGEDQRLVVLSVAEGADKPAKYPATFATADAVAINKLDLLPYVDCDVAAMRADILQLKPQMRLFDCSCRAGQESGLDAVADWLTALAAEKQGRR